MATMKETRSFRPFKSSEEYLYAMKEDLAEWLNMLYPELEINVDNFMDRLDTGVALCKHANSVRKSAEEYLIRRAARKMSMSTSTISTIALPITEHGAVHFLKAAKPGTFFARDNVSNFISWCRKGLGVFECLLFETDDLIMRKNEKHVILCLLDVARRGAKFGMLAPMLVQLEREIDREIAAEQRALQRANSCEEGQGYISEEEDEMEQEEYNVQYGPMPQIITNDLKSLDEMVRELVERCTCPVQFPMKRVSEGKYRIGDTKVLIFVRILRNHVMVRVGGGWDTLSHYLDKHDPCRCKNAHRSPLSAKLILKNGGGSLELNNAQVHYERSPPRTRRSSASSVGSGGRPDPYTLNPQSGRTSRNRSRSPTPRRNTVCTPTLQPPTNASNRARSRSPTPRRSTPNVNLQAPPVNGRTTPNRNRSRSPTPRRSLQPPGTNSGRTTPNRNRSRSPTPSRFVKRKVSTQPCDDNGCPEILDNHVTSITAKQENDSGSEVSDEGYRSLGTVIVTSPPLNGEPVMRNVGKVIVNGEERVLEKRHSVDSECSKRASVSSTFSNEDGLSTTPDESITITTLPTGTVITISDPLDDPTPMVTDEDSPCHHYASSVDDDTVNYTSPRRSLVENSSYGKENTPLRQDSLDGSPRRTLQKNSLPADPRRQTQSPVTADKTGAQRRTRSHSIDNGDQYEPVTPEVSPRRSSIYRSLRSDPRTAKGTSGSMGKASGRQPQTGTWSSRGGGGGGKTRPALTPTTYANTQAKTPGLGARNSYLRSSLGSHGSAHSTPTRKVSGPRSTSGQSVSLTTSPTKEISPLVKQILDVNDLGDDAKVLDKMREIIRQYKDIVDERLLEENQASPLPQGPELDFTSTWVHNNGSLQGIQHGGPRGDAIAPSPRKDSKAESFTSKIPAPVSFRSNSVDVGRES